MVRNTYLRHVPGGLVVKTLGFQVALVIKNPPATAGDIRDAGSIPGLGTSPGGGYGNTFQYSCLENPMDRGPGTTVHRVAELDTAEATEHACMWPLK